MNLLTHFDQFATKIPARGGVVSLREKALEFLNAKGLPTRKDEDWKYTSVKVLNDEVFVPAGVNDQQPSHETLKAIQSKLNPAFINIVFHNGVFNKTLSSVDELPKGVQFKESAEASTAHFKDSFEALNAAYFTKNYLLEIFQDLSVDKVVNFVFYSSLEGGPSVMVNPQVTLKVGARASAKFLESYYGQSDSRYFVNSQVNVQLEESAKLIAVRLQSDSTQAVNIGRSNYTLGKSSHLHSLVFSTGAALSRHNLSLELKQPQAFAVVDGVYVTKGSQHVDNATVIDHQVGNCDTSQHYKGILADRSRAVFNGKVIIRHGALKANSAQLNNNLLLSREAEADSQPRLEIYADDVKASHGSTVGQLNREELFYLESRAIAPEVAIPMLSFGYASELIYKLENEELQSWLNKELHEAFKGLQVAVK